ncbi:MAG TPA: transposase [Thermoanaerobaculia bacterium]|nr:transposase [Thermoanaerobaculia bacterium]
MAVGFDTYAYRRDLPHLAKDGKTYFVTFRALRFLKPADRTIVLDHCVFEHEKTCWLDCVVVMPDHVHLIATPHESWPLSLVMQRIKGVSSHSVNRVNGTHGTLWQHESFDHILRSDESLGKKVEYVCQNPVRAGLAATPEEYPWLWRAASFCVGPAPSPAQ